MLLLKLNDDCLHNVLIKLNDDDLKNCMLVDKQLNNITMCGQLWQYKLNNDYENYYIKNDYYNSYIKYATIIDRNILNILTFLDVHDIITYAIVNKQYAKLTKNKLLWKNINKRVYPNSNYYKLLM